MKSRISLSSRNKFTMMFILLILLPLIVLNLFLVVVQMDRNTKQYMTEQKYNFYSVPTEIGAEFELGFSYASSISTDYDLFVFLNKKYDTYQEYYENYEGYRVDKLLNMSSVENENISVPVLYTTNSTIYETPVTKVISTDIKEEKWYVAFAESGEETHLYFDESTRYAYIISELSQFGNSDFSQFVMLRIDLDYISNSLEKVGVPCSAMLFGDDGKLLYSWEKDYIQASNANYYSTLSTDSEGEDISLIYTENIDTYGNLKLAIAIDKPFPFSVETLLSPLVTLLVTLLASFLFMKNIQRDYIDRIENLVESLDVDDLIAGGDKNSKNQLTLVEQTIGDMSGKIRDLLQKSFDLEMAKNQAEIRRKQSELNSLLSQINPHYLFNVLNAIRLKSLIKGEKETAKIILYVSKILRQSITWNQDVISLKEEIGFICEYLAIEKYRFEDKIEYNIESDDESLSCDIPKMCLQPFVENACVHGIQNVLETGRIDIKTFVKDEKLHITIENPSPCFTNEIKTQILNYSKGNFEIDTKSVGLKNTFGRLRFYYDDIQFDIDTSIEGYVTMTLILSKKVAHRVKEEDTDTQHKN